MRPVAVSILFLLTAGHSAVVAGIPPQQPPGEREQLEAQDPEGELERLSEEWMQAMTEQDRPALERFLAEDFELRGIGMPWHVEAEAWLDNAATTAHWEHGGFENLHVRRLDDVAMVSSWLSFSVEDATSWRPAVSTSAPVVDVWVRRDGRWQVAARYSGPWEIERWFDRIYGFLGGILLMSVLWILVRRRAGAG